MEREYTYPSDREAERFTQADLHALALKLCVRQRRPSNARAPAVPEDVGTTEVVSVRVAQVIEEGEADFLQLLVEMPDQRKRVFTLEEERRALIGDDERDYRVSDRDIRILKAFAQPEQW